MQWGIAFETWNRKKVSMEKLVNTPSPKADRLVNNSEPMLIS